MAIDGFRVDEPFYFSSSGSLDEVSMEHTGIDFLIKNTTGLTKIGDNTNYTVTINHTLNRLGVGIDTPTYGIHRYTINQNANIGAERSGNVITTMSARITEGFIGTANNFPFQIVTNNTMRVNIDTNGNVQIPAAYTTVIGGINTDLYIDNTGLIGPLPSFEAAKENITPLDDQSTLWVNDIPLKKFDFIGGAKDQIGPIAEDVATIHPGAVRYAIYEINRDETHTLLNASQYDLSEAFAGMVPGIDRDDLPVYRYAADENGNTIKIKEWKRLTLKPITVNRSDFIFPLLAEQKKLSGRVLALEQIILELKG